MKGKRITNFKPLLVLLSVILFGCSVISPVFAATYDYVKLPDEVIVLDSVNVTWQKSSEYCNGIGLWGYQGGNFQMVGKRYAADHSFLENYAVINWLGTWDQVGPGDAVGQDVSLLFCCALQSDGNNWESSGICEARINYEGTQSYLHYDVVNYTMPIASFNATPETGFPPLEVFFEDTSTPGIYPITSWLWDFNDYSQSSHPNNATHTFLMNGTYNVSMTVGDGIGEYTAYKNITVGNAPSIPGSYNLTVHVQDSNGVHIEGAHISLLVSTNEILTNMTNSVGISNFIAVPGSAAALIDVTKAGYPEYLETFTIASDMTKEITLGQNEIKLFVDVVDSIYGNLLDNVNVGIKNTTSGVWRNATGAHGALYYSTTGLNHEYPLAIGQTVVVAASKAGYLPDSETITIQGDSAVTLFTVKLHLVNINGSAPSSGNFTLGMVAGSMLTGREIAGASVTINELGRMGATNNGGVAWFYNVPVGSYTVLVSAPGYQAATTDVTGTDLETVMTRIDLLPTGYRQEENGTIIDPRGNPYQPWNPNYDPNGGVYNPNATAAAANERAADAITAFLDNAINIAGLVFILLLFWFIKKIIFT